MSIIDSCGKDAIFTILSTFATGLVIGILVALNWKRGGHHAVAQDRK